MIFIKGFQKYKSYIIGNENKTTDSSVGLEQNDKIDIVINNQNFLGWVAGMQQGMLQCMAEGRPSAIFENCIDHAQSALIGDESMHKRERVYMGNDVTGKPTYCWVEGDNQRELHDNIVKCYIKSGLIWEFMSTTPTGSVQDTEQAARTTTRFDTFALDWLERFVHHVKSETYYHAQKSRVYNAISYFSCIGIEDITVDSVQDYLNSNSSKSRDTVDHYLITLRQILDVAVDKEIISKNPAKAKCITSIGVHTSGSNPLSAKEFDDVTSNIATLTNPTEQMFLGLALYQGLRKEEILGLRWEHINFETNTISIEQAITYPGGKAVLKTPKTAASKDTIPLNLTLYKILKPHRQISGYVITDANGGIFKFQYQYAKFYKTMCDHINLYGRSCRDLRPTFANALRRKSVDLKVIQRLMRHENADITANTYLKTNDEEVWEYRDII